MLVSTKDKDSSDQMRNYDGIRKINLNFAFVSFSLLFGLNRQLYLPRWWYIPMEKSTNGITQKRKLKYFPQFNQWQRFYRNLSISVLNSFPSIFMDYLLFLREKYGSLKSSSVILRKQQCSNGKVNCTLFTASFSS